MPYYHHVREVIAETSLDASLGLTTFFAVDLHLALRVADVHPTYTEQDGTEKLVPNDIHHHDETLVDVTDPWLLGRFASVHGDFVGSMRLGLSFPLGRTEPDPYALGREGASHEHLQAGTGTFVPIVGFGASYRVAPVTIGLSGVGFFNAYENAEGFRAPVRVYANHRVSVALFDGVLLPFAEVTLAHESEEYWQGEPGLEGSNVRTELYVGGGAAWRFAPPWALELAIRGRVASLTDSPTLTGYGVFSLGLSTAFDLWDAEETAGDAKPAEIREEQRDGVTTFEKE